MPILFIRLVAPYIFFLILYIYIYILYLMTTDRIGLNSRIEGEIRHRSVANGLQNFQSFTNPFTFGSDKNLRIGLDQIGFTDRQIFCALLISICGLSTTHGYESISNPVWSCKCLRQTNVSVSWCILVRWRLKSGGAHTHPL